MPGEQLSCVIIDKLPFAVPSDPVVDARIRCSSRRTAAIRSTTTRFRRPRIALKQGFGRLIRSQSDRGVLVLLDNRITKQRYGQVFFDSLPDYGFTTEVAGRGEVFRCLKSPWKRHSPPATPCATIAGKCENVHGHNYRVQVTVEGAELN